jgi:hypothetical protein
MNACRRLRQTLPLRLALLPLVIVAIVNLVGCSSAQDTENALPVRCLDTPDPGPCNRRIPRFYYDYPSNTCRMFHHGGCGGHVPFESRVACERACVGGRD